MRDTEPARSVPDLRPDVYARWRASDVGAITERLEHQLIHELAGDVTGRSILDVGCGDGTLAVELWERGADVVGIDASNSMIEAARAMAQERGANIAFRTATAERLPFPPEHFDIVVATTVLCFMKDAAPVIREMARVLRPGGRIIIGELGRWSSWAAQRRIRGWLGSPLWREGKFRTARELRALANQAGLVAGPVRGAVYYPRWGLAARLLVPCDAVFGRVTTVGAAFLALSAAKPADEVQK